VNDEGVTTIRAVPEKSHREIIQKFFEAVNAQDWGRLEAWLDPEYVWEMPQSGERVRGTENNRLMNESYPGMPQLEARRITGSEDTWVTTPSFTVLKITGTGDDYVAESRASYPDGSVWHAVDLFHFRSGKIDRQTAYFAPVLEPAEWRARWAERI